MHFRKKMLGHVLSYSILLASVLPCSIISCPDIARTLTLSSKAATATQNKQSSSTYVEEPTSSETTTSQLTTMRTTTMTITSTIATTTTTTATTTAEETTAVFVEDQPVEEIDEIIENPEPIEFNYEEIWNGIIIHNHVIQTVLCPAFQANVDAYDVIQDIDYLSTEHNISLFGHNTGSFSILESVSVNDTLILVNDGIPSYYEVRRSELGQVNSEDTDIFSCWYGDSIFLADTGFEETLRLITCSSDHDLSYRWVVIAEKIG